METVKSTTKGSQNKAKSPLLMLFEQLNLCLSINILLFVKGYDALVHNIQLGFRCSVIIIVQ